MIIPDDGQFGIKFMAGDTVHDPMFSYDFGRDDRHPLMTFHKDDPEGAAAIPNGHRLLVFLGKPIKRFAWEIEIIGSLDEGKTVLNRHLTAGLNLPRSPETYPFYRPIRFLARVEPPEHGQTWGGLAASAGTELVLAQPINHMYLSAAQYKRASTSVGWTWRRSDEAPPVTTKRVDTGVVTPGTPFSNLLRLREVLRACKDYIWWLDKHFHPKGLELLVAEVEPGRISEIRILSSRANLDDAATRDFKRFCDELKKKGVVAEWRLDELHEVHDRFIISRDSCHNVPPVKALFSGAWSEINPAAGRPPFDHWWARAKNIFG